MGRDVQTKQGFALTSSICALAAQRRAQPALARPEPTKPSGCPRLLAAIEAGQLTAPPRTGQTKRRVGGRPEYRGQIADMVNISQRPAEAADRAGRATLGG